MRASAPNSCYGQHDANWLAFYKFFKDECGLVDETAKLEGLTELCQSAGWALPHEHICWVSERHSVCCRDERGRLHNLKGSALEYPDGFAIYAVHGVRVKPFIVLEPGKITVALIGAEKNAEVRRVMIDQYGPSRYVTDAGGREIDRSDYGTLYLKEVEGDEPIATVKVVNSTAEPDGTFKDYYLRVPPTIKTAREACAWTFGKAEADYEPAIQT